VNVAADTTRWSTTSGLCSPISSTASSMCCNCGGIWAPRQCLLNSRYLKRLNATRDVALLQPRTPAPYRGIGVDLCPLRASCARLRILSVPCRAPVSAVHGHGVFVPRAPYESAVSPSSVRPSLLPCRAIHYVWLFLLVIRTHRCGRRID